MNTNAYVRGWEGLKDTSVVKHLTFHPENRKRRADKIKVYSEMKASNIWLPQPFIPFFNLYSVGR